MARKKTIDERIDALKEDIEKKEYQVEEAKRKVTLAKDQLRKLESEAVNDVVKSFDLTPGELERLLAKHVPGQPFKTHDVTTIVN